MIGEWKATTNKPDEMGPNAAKAINAIVEWCLKNKKEPPVTISGWEYKGKMGDVEKYHIRTSCAKYKQTKRTVKLNPKLPLGTPVVSDGYV